MDKHLVVGLGIIGSIWLRHNAQDGLDCCGWNRTAMPENPLWRADLRASAAQATLIHICLAGPDSVGAVLNQIEDLLGPHCLVIQSSTISPTAAEAFAAQVTARGAAYVEAPFTGSKPAAQSRQLVFFPGGTASALQRALPYLERLSRLRIEFASPRESAAIKLAMNLQIAAISQAMTEGMQLAAHYGLGLDRFFEVLDANVARSGLVDLKRPKFEAQDYSPQFSVQHMAKDLRLAVEAGEGIGLPLTRRCLEVYEAGLSHGMAAEDFIALAKLTPEQRP